MQIIHQHSLGATLDAINEAFFYNHPLPEIQRKEAAGWLTGHQGKNSSYTGFTPTSHDRTEGVRLFTGERLRTRHPGNDVLGIEACRALILLGTSGDGIQAALRRADQGLFDACFTGSCVQGECAHAMVSTWRYLAAGGFSDPEQRLDAYMKVLFEHRDGKGRWKRFPFYYTLLALSELNHPAAIREMQYVAPTCERYLRRAPKDDRILQRRRDIMERVLARR